jgi:hypothetical protein
MVTKDPNGPSWLLEEAWRQVGRASTSEDRARALSSFRRAIATAGKQAGAASPELLPRLRQLEDEARKLYNDSADLHVRKALRGLGSLRMAIEARLAANAPDDADEIAVSMSVWEGGPPSMSWMGSARKLCDAYGVPEDVRARAARIQVTLNLVGTVPEVQVLDDAGEVVWYRPPSGEVSTPKLRPHIDQSLLTGETGGNGHDTANP